MHIRKSKQPYSVTLPDGRELTRADLPAPGTCRWVASRKARVVLAVTTGLITMQEALDMYHLSEEEYASWVHAISVHGMQALKTTQIQKFRQL